MKNFTRYADWPLPLTRMFFEWNMSYQVQGRCPFVSLGDSLHCSYSFLDALSGPFVKRKARGGMTDDQARHSECDVPLRRLPPFPP